MFSYFIMVREIKKTIFDAYSNPIFIGAILFALCFAMSTAHPDVVVLKGGNELKGSVVRQTESQVTLQLEGGGEMAVPADLVESIEIIEPTATSEPEYIPSPTPSSTPMPLQIIEPTPTAESLASKEVVESVTDPAELSEEEILKLGGGRTKTGIMKDTVGLVEIQRPGEDWKATDDTVLFEGDRLRTRLGRTKVLIDQPESETEIRVKEETEVEMPRGEPSTVDLRKGKVWSRLRSLSDAGDVKFNIRTPNAIAGIRGTLLYVQILQNDSKVAVFEGAVLVSGRTQPQQQQQVDRMKALVVTPQEQFSPLRDVDPNELREWEEWDEWAEQTKAALAPYVRGKPGGAVVEGMVDQVAAEGKLHSQIVGEANQQILLNRQAEFLDTLRDAVLEYTSDVGQLPSQNFGLTCLQNNLVGSPNWRGPYLPEGVSLPVRDGWGNKIIYEVRTSEVSGREYALLVSCGPDGRYSQGKGDDIKTLVNPR